MTSPAAARANGAPAPTVLEPLPASRRIVLPVDGIDPDGLGIGELLDLADVFGTDLDGIAALMRDRSQVARSRMVVGLAWLMVRRLEPAVTWAEAQTWRVEVTPARLDPPLAPLDGAERAGL